MKGRKPKSDNVVPLTEEGQGANFEQRALARARELKPEGLPFTVSAIWDRLAPPLCDPRKNRINEISAYMFEQLCYAVDAHELHRVDLRDNGWTYKSLTRNGEQWKSRPEVAQYHATWEEVRKLASDFGMTPAAERGLQVSGQLGFNFEDEGGGSLD